MEYSGLNDVTWASYLLKSPAARAFVQQFVQTNKELSKIRISGPLWKETIDDFPSQRVGYTEKVFISWHLS